MPNYGPVMLEIKPKCRFTRFNKCFGHNPKSGPKHTVFPKLCLSDPSVECGYVICIIFLLERMVIAQNSDSFRNSSESCTVETAEIFGRNVIADESGHNFSDTGSLSTPNLCRTTLLVFLRIFGKNILSHENRRFTRTSDSLSISSFHNQ